MTLKIRKKEKLVTPNGKPLTYYTIPEMWKREKERIKYKELKKRSGYI